MAFRIQIQEGGAGFECWNADAIEAYAAKDESRATEVLRAVPDATYHAGVITCRGCMLGNDGFGSCTAAVRNSLYAENGREPSQDDSIGSTEAIEGFEPTSPNRIDPIAQTPRAA